jgi:hypothetical protein
MMLDKLSDDLAAALDDLRRVQDSIEILTHLLKATEGDRLPDTDLARYGHHLIDQALLTNETATDTLTPWLSRLS